MPFEVASDVVCLANLDLLSVMEELGAVVTHLREARDACETRNMGAIRCDMEDATDCLNRIESECSRVAADLQKWLSIPQNDHSEGREASPPPSGSASYEQPKRDS